MSIPVPLSKPIKAHGDDVEELALRRPTTEEIIEIGLPQLFVPSADGQGTGVEIRTPIVARYVSRLAAIPMSSVKLLDPKDFSLCTTAVLSFFGDGEA